MCGISSLTLVLGIACTDSQKKIKKTKEINGKYTSVEKGDGIVDLHTVRGKEGEKEEEEE